MSDWAALASELRVFRQSGLSLPIWWRDDDAAAPTAALDRLATLSTRLQVAVHCAIVPAAARPELVEAMAEQEVFLPLVHGWAHANHAPADQKKAEFGAHRPLAARLSEAANGLGRLSSMFGARMLPVLVPPWNRIGDDMKAELAALGYRALSTFGPRETRDTAPGLMQINTHLDPIDWRGTRSLKDSTALLTQLVRDLADRREQRSDNSEPYGILTHHLVHDKAIWDFTGHVLAALLDGGARPVTLDQELLP